MVCKTRDKIDTFDAWTMEENDGQRVMYGPLDDPLFLF